MTKGLGDIFLDSNVWNFNRSILISDSVTQSSVGNALSQIIYLIENDDKSDKKEKDFKRQPIKIYLNTNGGSIYDGLALIDVIANSQTPIYTYAIGKCFSMGVPIFAVGKKRFIGKYATLLLHTASSVIRGDTLTMGEDLEQVKKIDSITNEILTTKTDVPLEKLLEIKKNKFDWYIDAKQAKELKIADYFLEEEFDLKED